MFVFLLETDPNQLYKRWYTKCWYLNTKVCDMNQTAEANSAFDWCLLLPSCLCVETRSSQGLKGIAAFSKFRAKTSKVSVHRVHFPTNDISSKSSVQVRLLFHDGEIFCRLSPLWRPSPQRQGLLFIKADPLPGISLLQRGPFDYQWLKWRIVKQSHIWKRSFHFVGGKLISSPRTYKVN